MWLAAFAMLILALGYLLLVVVSVKIRASREEDSGTPRQVGEATQKTS